MDAGKREQARERSCGTPSKRPLQLGTFQVEARTLALRVIPDMHVSSLVFTPFPYAIPESE